MKKLLVLATLGMFLVGCGEEVVTTPKANPSAVPEPVPAHSRTSRTDTDASAGTLSTSAPDPNVGYTPSNQTPGSKLNGR